LFRSQAQFNKE